MGDSPRAAHDALRHARRIQADAAALGFDWPDVSGALAKVTEEAQELAEALAEGDKHHASKELGDLLFAAVNVARFLNVAPDEALRETCVRFSERFAYVKKAVHEAGREMQSCSLVELDAFWETAKVIANQQGSEGG